MFDREKFKNTSLGDFLNVFDKIGVKYEVIPANKNSIDTRDILGYMCIKIYNSSYYLSFDSYGTFISVLNNNNVPFV